MDTRVLRWFQQVADGVSVTEVSDLEATTQSGVSRALARLEKEVGTPLLRRTDRTLRMTHAGVAFKHHVDALMFELDDGLAAVSQLVDPETGTVAVSFEPDLGTWLVPDLVGGFRVGHPGVRFDLRPMRDELASTVRTRGAGDVELSTRRPQAPDVRWRRLVREPLRLAVPAAHRLASCSRVALAEVSDLPFVALRPTSLLRHLCDELCAAAGFSPGIAFACDDLPTVEGFVAAGLGVAIVPASRTTEAGSAASRVRRLPITDGGAVREVGVTWSSERKLLPAAELFTAYVVDRAGSTLLAAVGGGADAGADGPPRRTG